MAGQPGETLHLAWTHNETGKRWKTRQLRHVFSTDGGKTWNRSAPVDLPARPRQIHLAADTCGTAHVVFQSSGPSGIRLYYLRWIGTKGGWSEPRLLSDPSKIALGAALDRWQDRLRLVWNEVPPPPPGGGPPPEDVAVTTLWRSLAVDAG
jgi:hypothetical protein